MENWQSAVLGAAGKMGSGISLLLLQQLASEKAKSKAKNKSEIDTEGSTDSTLTLIDTNEAGFISLRHYLKEQLTKFAERNINDLRTWYANCSALVDNADMIEAFVEDAFDKVRMGSALEECRGARLVFEAILEDVEVKAAIFAKLDKILGPEAFYFSNTSSIPIRVLQEKSHLESRIIGFHFYNPPAIQKLLEIIVPQNIDPLLKETALQISKRLNKTTVFAHDIAGFIGNGHLIREVHFACQKVEELSGSMPLTEALFIVNFVTQEYLIRPMGIFQLLDYVGIDVCKRITQIMTTYLSDSAFDSPLIDTMVNQKIWGGQYGDGSQKDGFFHYEKGMPVAIYDIKEKKYLPCQDEKSRNKYEKILGKLPEGHTSWKGMSKDPKKEDKLRNYFSHFWQSQGLGVELASNFLYKSHEIAYGLVSDGVADSIDDVDTVLKNGFFHLYGVDAPFQTASKSIGKKYE